MLFFLYLIIYFVYLFDFILLLNSILCPWCSSGTIPRFHHQGPGSIPRQGTNPAIEGLMLSAGPKPR